MIYYSHPAQQERIWCHEKENLCNADRSCDGVVVHATVCATTDLLDMANPDPADWPHRVALRYDAPTDTYQPADGSHPPAMFFTWRLSVAPSAD